MTMCSQLYSPLPLLEVQGIYQKDIEQSGKKVSTRNRQAFCGCTTRCKEEAAESSILLLEKIQMWVSV